MDEPDYSTKTGLVIEKRIYSLINERKYYSAFSTLILCHTDLFREITDRNPNLINDLTEKLRGENDI